LQTLGSEIQNALARIEGSFRHGQKLAVLSDVVRFVWNAGIGEYSSLLARNRFLGVEQSNRDDCREELCNREHG